ncbi:uncharacterized protein LOC110458986 isoform X2 [Mizuhopecten yessoensis]|uniref:uncharacterized protein LOC110458986 isoform X2 n=1 Tax=Mizuhopecten yessoensis TaxID=6573 RepID=UPI000B4577AA|nr:uncharacterized protein LOC110458986 isoform X2 [Mizuhopecten yessoensis]
MHTAVSIFQLLSLTKMLTICCSAGDVYVSTEKRTWAASHQDNNCSLAKSSGNITINYTVSQAPTLAWVNEILCSTRRVWINMTGCFNLAITSDRSRHFPVDGYEDPVVFCLQKCDSDKVFLTSTECYCSENVNVTIDSPCQGCRCGKHNNRVCGSSETTLNNDTKCVCGFEKTNISTNESGNCMSTNVSGNIFVYEVQNCSQQMPVLCTDNRNAQSFSPDQQTNWTGALTKCSQGGHFIGVKNGSSANQNYDQTIWIGLFSVELTQITCMAINITNDDHKITQQNCSQLLPSLCIDQTVITSSNQATELPSTPVATSQNTTNSLVTEYSSTSTTTTTTTITKLSTERTTQKENANLKSSSGFPTLAVGFGAGGAVALILVLLMVVVFYRRRKQHNSNNSKNDVSKSYDGNPTNTQQITSETMIKDNKDYTVENRIISNVLSDDTEDSAGLGDYDHLDTHKNRELTHNHGRPAEAYYNSRYDHVGHQLVSSQTDQDVSAYNNFSQNNESVLFSGEEYDHIVRNIDMYDHMGTELVTTAEESDYDHTRSGERVWSETSRNDTGSITPKNVNTFHDHPSSEGNYDKPGGNGQWHTLNSDRPKNGQNKYYTEAQYDHLPSARVKREISHSHEGDYDHTLAVDEYDRIGSVNKGHRRSVVQEDEYDHVTEL